MICGSSSRRMLVSRRRRYGGPMTWRSVPARMRALGPVRLDALTAAIVAAAATIDVLLATLHDHRGVTYAAALALSLALAFRRRATLAVVVFQAVVVAAQEIAGGEALDAAFVPFLAV